MEPTNTPLPSAFPEGWYFVASRKDLEKAKLVRKTWMGTEIVASGENGHVCVAEAYCPHLGSDLGPSVGGRVRNGRLVCPFHGFEYVGQAQRLGHHTVPRGHQPCSPWFTPRIIDMRTISTTATAYLNRRGDHEFRPVA